ncbi:uncharacterized protein BX663DRAFT_475975 [Cokeromyces recurvatus]|uniref:uncharacterized protein n=1 Tax=Cokeromyces recurvatus TaxID=90255 RepID=UPI00222079D1|nr:uncharacterized protein BX663DRAFT_475975 [Cokeromyces recurvatus]KAI7900964.1 hypothetical protein BX663DRAFT_475975 [Cokeromyces recurvatus]
MAKNNKAPQEYIQRATSSGRPVGRSPILTREHKDLMIEWADEKIRLHYIRQYAKCIN